MKKQKPLNTLSTLSSYYDKTRQNFRDSYFRKTNQLSSHFRTITLGTSSTNKNSFLSSSTLYKPIPTNLTEKDSEYLSTIYTTSDYKGISTKYNISSQLSYDEQSWIKQALKKSKDKSIVYSSNSRDKLYSDPFKSQEILNINNEVYTKINNIRMQTQTDKFVSKINSVVENKKVLSKMPKIRVSKMTISSIPVRRISTTNSNVKNPKSTKEDKERKSQAFSSLVFSTIKGKSLFGGMTREQMLNEVKLSMDFIPTQYHPFSRDQFALTITEDDVIFIFGGVQGKKLSDLWSFELNSKSDNLKWQKIIPVNDDYSPIPRYGHSMVYYDNHLYIFGGCIKENYWRGREENISVYDILNKQYSYPNCQNYKNVPWRRNHLGIGIGYTMLVFGGIDDDEKYLNDMWIFDIQKYKWSPLLFRSKLRIPQIAFHSGCLVIKNNSVMLHTQLSIYKLPEVGGKSRGSKPKLEGVYVFGGMDKDGNYSNTLWCIRIGTKPVDVIYLKAFGKPPIPRMSCGICYLNELNLIVIHGGKNDTIENNEILNDIMLLDLETFNWIRPVYKEEDFKPVCGHVNFGYANSIYILGGFNNSGFAKFDFYSIEFDFLKRDEDIFGVFY